jgi:hypothetical protein
MTKARAALQHEIRLVKDLLFLKSLRMTLLEEDAINDAIQKATAVSAIYSLEYARAAVELIALNAK